MVNFYIVSKDFPGVSDMKLIRCDLYKDSPRGYSIHTTYRVETPTTIKEYDMPRISLPIADNMLEIRSEADGACTANIGFGDMTLLPDKNGVRFTIRETPKAINLDETPKEMTLDEIEKKLGHKVKIVNKK